MKWLQARLLVDSNETDLDVTTSEVCAFYIFAVDAYRLLKPKHNCIPHFTIGIDHRFNREKSTVGGWLNKEELAPRILC